MTTAALKEPTHREAHFIKIYEETGNASESYRQAYTSDNMKPDTIKNAAYRVLHRPHVNATLQARKAEREQDRKDLADKAKEHADKALEIAVALMEDTEEPGSTRLAALREVLDRGHGRAISKTELDATIDNSSRTVEEMTDEQLIAMIKGESAAH